jgi:hypothetical protein
MTMASGFAITIDIRASRTAYSRPRDRRGRFGQRPARPFHESFARLRQVHAVRTPREQRHAQFTLQIMDRATQRRLGDVQMVRGAPDTMRVGDRDERPQVPYLHGATM